MPKRVFFNSPFGCASQQVKGGIVIQEEVLWISGLRSNDIGTLNWVSAEKDRLLTSEKTSRPVEREEYPVQAYDIIVALASVELNCESAGIAGRIWELSAKGDSGEANEDGCFGASGLQEVSFTV